MNYWEWNIYMIKRDRSCRSYRATQMRLTTSAVMQMMRTQMMKDFMRPLPLTIQQSIHRSLSSTSQPVNLPQHGRHLLSLYKQKYQAANLLLIFPDSTTLSASFASNTPSTTPLSASRVSMGLNTPSRQSGKCLL